MKRAIIAGMLLAACLAVPVCQGDPFADFFHSNQSAKKTDGVIHLEGTILEQIHAGLYLVNMEPACAARSGLGHSHDDPTLLHGPNDTVIVEHNAVREWVRVVLRGEPQERNDVTIGCWVIRDGDYKYHGAETMPAFKACGAPPLAHGNTQGSSGADSKTTGSASGQ